MWAEITDSQAERAMADRGMCPMCHVHMWGCIARRRLICCSSPGPWNGAMRHEPWAMSRLPVRGGSSADVWARVLRTGHASARGVPLLAAPVCITRACGQLHVCFIYTVSYKMEWEWVLMRRQGAM